MSYSPIELREMAEHLLDIARTIGPEGEGVDLDEDFTLEELVQLRTFLSATRKACDLVNSGLARYWEAEYPGQEFDDKYVVWSVGRTKRKRAADGDALLAWMAEKDAEGLGKVVNPNRLADILKVSGLTPAERDTLIIEEYPPHSGVSINYKEKK